MSTRQAGATPRVSSSVFVQARRGMSAVFAQRGGWVEGVRTITGPPLHLWGKVRRAEAPRGD